MRSKSKQGSARRGGAGERKQKLQGETYHPSASMSWVRAISTSSSATHSAAWVTLRYPRSCFNSCECPAAGAPDDDDTAGEAAKGGPRGECCQRPACDATPCSYKRRRVDLSPLASSPVGRFLGSTGRTENEVAETRQVNQLGLEDEWRREASRSIKMPGEAQPASGLGHDGEWGPPSAQSPSLAREIPKGGTSTSATLFSPRVHHIPSPRLLEGCAGRWRDLEGHGPSGN